MTDAYEQAKQNRINVIEQISNTYGLLTKDDVEHLLVKPITNIPLLTVERSGDILYPAFQFDMDNHKVKYVIHPLVNLAVNSNWDKEDVVFWLVSPTTYFQGAKPVDHIDDTVNLLKVADLAWNISW